MLTPDLSRTPPYHQGVFCFSRGFRQPLEGPPSQNWCLKSGHVVKGTTLWVPLWRQDGFLAQVCSVLLIVAPVSGSLQKKEPQNRCSWPLGSQFFSQFKEALNDPFLPAKSHSQEVPRDPLGLYAFKPGSKRPARLAFLRPRDLQLPLPRLARDVLSNEFVDCPQRSHPEFRDSDFTWSLLLTL